MCLRLFVFLFNGSKSLVMSWFLFARFVCSVHCLSGWLWGAFKDDVTSSSVISSSVWLYQYKIVCALLFCSRCCVIDAEDMKGVAVSDHEDTCIAFRIIWQYESGHKTNNEFKEKNDTPSLLHAKRMTKLEGERGIGMACMSLMMRMMTTPTTMSSSNLI